MGLSMCPQEPHPFISHLSNSFIKRAHTETQSEAEVGRCVNHFFPVGSFPSHIYYMLYFIWKDSLLCLLDVDLLEKVRTQINTDLLKCETGLLK